MQGVVVLVILSLFIPYSHGLKCYNCVYLDDKLPNGLSLPPGVSSETSCKAGGKPDKKFSVDCSKLIGYPRNSGNETGVVNVLTHVFGNTYPILNGPSQVNGTNYTVSYTCAKLSYDGNFLPKHDGKKMKAMFRSCIRKVAYRNATFQQQCQSGKMDKLNIQDSDVRSIVYYQSLGPEMNQTKTDVSICTCGKDDCNGGLKNAHNISIFGLFFGLAVVLFKQSM